MILLTGRTLRAVPGRHQCAMEPHEPNTKESVTDSPLDREALVFGLPERVAPPASYGPAPSKVFWFATSEDSEACIEWIGPVTWDSFDTLISMLEAQKFG